MRLTFISWINQLVSFILVYGQLMYAHGGEPERNPIKERNVQHPLLLG